MRVEFTDPHLVLKDPRLCITLPLWRTVFDPAPVAILVLRDPLEVARSLEHRNDFPLTLSLALWRRYVQQSVAAVEGLPVFVVEYGELLRDPAGRVHALNTFLSEHGLPVNGDVSVAVEALAPDLRHHRDDIDADLPSLEAVLSEQREFADALVRHGQGRCGPRHRCRPSRRGWATSFSSWRRARWSASPRRPPGASCGTSSGHASSARLGRSGEPPPADLCSPTTRRAQVRPSPRRLNRRRTE